MKCCVEYFTGHFTKTVFKVKVDLKTTTLSQIIAFSNKIIIEVFVINRDSGFLLKLEVKSTQKFSSTWSNILFKQKCSKNRNIAKYYYKLKELFSI